MVTRPARHATPDEQVVHLDDGPLARSFATQLDSLRGLISSAWHPGTPEAGFVEWAVARSGSTVNLGVDSLDIDAIPAHRWTEAPTLAAVGFQLDVAPKPVVGAARWLKGMRRLMTRDPVPVDRNSFFFSSLELLGLATGARSLEATDASPLGWLRETINAQAHLLPTATVWSRGLVSIAAQQVGAQPVTADPILPKIPLDTAVLLWLDLLDYEIMPAVISTEPPKSRQELLKAAATTEPELRSTAERGIFAIALQDAVLNAVGRIELHPTSAAEFVVRVCRRFPLFAHELGNRYNKREPFNINDEYDVQDLLRASLLLHFSDVRQEEWNPSYGGVQSRSDLLLMPERVVIETKMTRPSLGQRKLVEQLTIDKDQYRGHPDYESLVCFVYDPDHRLENPVAIERDLSGNADGLRTLVVVSPQGL